MDRLICLDENYSTTKMLYKIVDDEYLDENGTIKEKCKWNINNSTFKIQHSTLFLPEGEGRKGEGGLRTKGYFKLSYENLMINDECLILNDKEGNQYKSNNSTFNIKHPTLSSLPLISIITVVFNGEKYLEETIQSVINQTYPNVEYIIIDGGSTDGTLDIIKKYEDKIDYWVSEKDDGMYEAIHKGFMLSTGEIYSWLNADDKYYPWTLVTVSKIFQKKSYVKWLTGIPSHINKYSELINVEHPKYYFQYFIKKGYYRGDYLGFIQQESTFFRSSLYKKHPLNPKLKLAGDYNLWLKFASSERLFTVKTILASFRIHQNQKSDDIDRYYNECNIVSKNTKVKFLKYFIKPISILMNRKLIRPITWNKYDN